MNSENMTKIIATTIYIVVVVFVALIFISIVISIIQPTFFPNADISGFEDIIKTSNSFLGVSSVVLAIYSVFQARKGNLETKEILKEVKEIHSDVKTALNQKSKEHVVPDASIGNKPDNTI